MSLSSNFPTIRPSLLLDFAKSRTVDPRITFTRASTATYFDEDGILQSAAADRPRIDFNPSTLVCNGLLIEEQRTNSFTYSEQFDNAAWDSAAGSRTVTANSIIAPNGTTTADTVTADGTNNPHFVSHAVTLSATPYAVSVFAKAGTNNFIQLRTFAALNGAFANFDLANGVVGSVGATSGATPTSFIQFVGNGWYRCTMVFTPTAASSSIGIYLITSAASGGGASNTLNTSVYLWGAQLETGAFETSYIPTTTTALTRSSDVASMTGTNFSSWYNASEGTLYVESQKIGTVNFQRVAGFSDGSFDNRIYIGYGSGNPNALVFAVTTSTSGQVSLTLVASSATNTNYKVAAAYKQDDFAASDNGDAALTDTSGTVPTVSRLNIGIGDNASSNPLNGHIRRLTYYPARLVNAQLQALTL